MSKDLKCIVQEKYSKIANQSKARNETSCCGSTGCCDSVDYTIFSDDYSKLRKATFRNIYVEKEKEIKTPNAIMLKYISMDELRKSEKEKVGIYSITVKAKKIIANKLNQWERNSMMS